MKKSLTLFLALCALTVHSQTVLYTQNFNGTVTDWSLNTSDLGGSTSVIDNQWVINNIYAGYTSGACLITVPATANEPAGIAGYPNSPYLHIYSEQWVGLCMGTANCNYDAGTSETFFAALNTPIVSTGYTGVTLTFWWLCQGDATSYGKVYYRTTSGGTWTAVSTAIYNLSSSWTQVTIPLAAFDNQPFLEFGFQFTVGATGNDPAFAIDDVNVTGTPSGTPVPSFSVTPSLTTCQDSCLIFTNTTTGSVDSITWTMPGTTIAHPHGNIDTVCFSSSGTHVMTLTAYRSGSTYTATQTVSVIPTPHPTITAIGSVNLTASTGYSSYQWYNGLTLITGATTNIYTIMSSGTYTLIVDSAGCTGYSSPYVYSPLVIPANQTGNEFRASLSGNNILSIFSTIPIQDNISVNLFDATGRIVWNDTWEGGSNSKQISGRELPSGLYVLKLSNLETSVIIKLMK